MNESRKSRGRKKTRGDPTGSEVGSFIPLSDSIKSSTTATATTSWNSNNLVINPLLFAWFGLAFFYVQYNCVITHKVTSPLGFSLSLLVVILFLLLSDSSVNCHLNEGIEFLETDRNMSIKTSKEKRMETSSPPLVRSLLSFLLVLFAHWLHDLVHQSRTQLSSNNNNDDDEDDGR